MAACAVVLISFLLLVLLWKLLHRPDLVRFGWDAGGTKLVFVGASRGGGDLFALDLGTQRVTRLTDTADLAMDPSFAPDGATIVYTVQRDFVATLWLLDAEGATRRVTEPAIYDAQPCFSPDGKQVAFARSHRKRRYSFGGWAWDKWEVAVLDLRSGNVRELTHAEYYQLFALEWSPDGRRILYTAEHGRDAERGWDLHTVAADGSAAPELMTRDGRSYHGCHSPNGETVVFASSARREFRLDLVAMPAAGGERRMVLEAGRSHPARYEQPRYLQPGEIGVLGTDGTDAASLWAVHEDGTGLRLVADDRLFRDPLRWRPTGP